ncbi:guanosine-3',5'-bis(diphosphate) 3'-pyrophosphohydrolase MESH1 [Anopheles aquasalis]|uniref:guanosine-3',5'-bis(diphosphate) 3'-pyrophosphohydrolase MESH1 n=1 Tax=Anopheles aquasalis TaxID=42839 RepID=UPI00215A82BC|nr:guanosine-3',5'-bis(diphosphate) 3'-pyrophosphohydrolase MESH1 [Anopheles aquasalis]
MMESAKNPQDLLVAYTKCINFAAIKHRDQRRKDKEETPYINHPIGVAYILSSEGGISDSDVLSAAILHDTVEDTDTTFEEIENHFGPTVRSLVQEVTDDKSLPKQERKRLQIEHARTISHGAQLVKLADKIYNLRDLQRCRPKDWTEERCQEYFRWAKQVCDNLKGTNEPLERILGDIFRQENVI